MEVFETIKESLLNIDPVYWIEKNLTLDGKPFRLNGNGYRPYVDMYRYIGVKALEKDSKPVVIVAGRQVGKTTLASALELYFVASGLFGAGGKPPMRVMHAFPQLDIASAYTKTKLNTMITSAVAADSMKRGKTKSVIEMRLDKNLTSNDSLFLKQFENGNHIWIESTGLNGDRLRGRQLCLETELPTPTGFVKLKDLKEGDRLFDENGKVCNVTKLHPINQTPEAYRVTFDDGATVDACAEHLWATYTKRERAVTNKYAIRNTKEIYDTQKIYGESNHSIMTCLPVEYSRKDLLVDPYLLGLWVGDKSIPIQYMQSSYEQRLALLQGLMDSDGCYKNGRCEFVQVESRKELFFQVKELIESLGIKTHVYYKESRRFDVQYQSKYQLIFTTDKPVFRSQRKLINLKSHSFTTQSTHRIIKSVEKIPSKPMRCITVDSPSHLYLITRSFIPTHNTVDCIFFDEIQKITKEAISNSTKILAQAQYGKSTKGVQVYFGTPLQSGSAFWEMWTKSNQQLYHLRCGKCNEYFPLYTPGSNEWEKIWLYGKIVRCTHCQHEQDKIQAAERGKWIQLNSDPKADYIGYHINQLYNPQFTKEDIINEKPENSAVNTERAYMNEVLGEFYSGSSAPITPLEIQAKCADIGRKFTRGISSGKNRKVYAGFDWGDKGDADQGKPDESSRRGQSFSCGVVMTAEGPHILSIEFATKFKQNDPAYKKELVDEIMRNYNVDLAIGDVGHANDLTYILQQEHGDKFLAARSTGYIRNHIKFSDDIFPKEIVFDKDYYVGELYSVMKDGKIRFPFGEYEKIAWLINHCCSMEIKTTLDRGGEIKQHYVKGSSPNDGFMAVMYCFLAHRFDITNGFKNMNPKDMDLSAGERKPISAILGYIPKLR